MYRCHLQFNLELDSYISEEYCSFRRKYDCLYALSNWVYSLPSFN
jgi:hypothetical protein